MTNTLPSLRVCNLDLLNSSRQDAVAMLLDGARRRVAFINADCINIAARNTAYARNIDTMDALLPDGSGLAIAAGMIGRRFTENLNGTDLFPILCEQAAAGGKSIYFLGGAPGVAERAAQAAMATHPGLHIVGAEQGYLTDEAKTVERINASNADILLVAMGAPRQEDFIALNSNALTATLCMGVGGLFDFIAGDKPRAPAFMRRTGCEWAWRMSLEPTRLARRYLIGNPLFLARAMRSAWVGHGRRAVYQAIKRVMDLAVAGGGVVALSPLLALVTLAIAVESRGNPFFTQTRIGKDGKAFRMIKFRTMYQDAEDRLAAIRADSTRDSICFKMVDDPRVTRVGRVLRKSSLDELPQFFNVLRGEMSVVGPRPALPSEVAQYSETERARLDGAPGITCLWQIAGRADLKFAKQVDLDIAYLRSTSIWLDIAIIALTPVAILSRRGAY